MVSQRIAWCREKPRHLVTGRFVSVVGCERRGETQEEKTGYFSYSLAKIDLKNNIVLSVDEN